MTEKEAIDIIAEKHFDAELYFAEHDRYPRGYDVEFDQAILIAAQALKEIQQYREMEKKLKLVYGDCEGLLETVVFHLVKHEGIDLRTPVVKARLLTDETVERWEAYKAIGTVEECRAAVEKQEPMRIKEIHVDWYCCPACGAENNCDQGRVGAKFCPNCGQAIDRSEEE